MVKNPSVLAIIPARAGSKRLPGKNIRPLLGKPLIAWSIEAAIESGIATQIVVSSDSAEVLEIAAAYKVSPLERPAALASDEASTMDVVLHAINQTGNGAADNLGTLLLQPTSPLRNADDIRAAHALFVQNGEHNLVSVCELDHPVEWSGHIDPNHCLQGLDVASGKRSQDYRRCYQLNGAIYLANARELKTHKTFFARPPLAYVMPKCRSIDIDTADDFLLSTALASLLKPQGSVSSA